MKFLVAALVNVIPASRQNPLQMASASFLSASAQGGVPWQMPLPEATVTQDGMNLLFALALVHIPKQFSAERFRRSGVWVVGPAGIHREVRPSDLL